MKSLVKVFLSAIVITFIFSSCATQHVAMPKGPDRGLFVGTWTVTSVTYTNLIEGAVTSAFDAAPPKDFIGSKWELTNSGNGSYTLANGAKQDIYWSVNSGDALGAIFQFKKINAGQSAKDVTTGYQLVVSNNLGTTMILKTLVYLGNKNGYVVYSFTKDK